jgi:thiamine pyrophosphate-dependent acetolactate synthase large subunit-like protein
MTRPNRKTVSAAQAIVDSLVEHGVDTIFGIPGAHTYKLFDALYERRREIRFVGTRHEQGAAYMAFGATAYRAVNPGEFKSTLIGALNDSGPVLIEVPSEPGSEVSPWPFLHPWSAGR